MPMGSSGKLAQGSKDLKCPASHLWMDEASLQVKNGFRLRKVETAYETNCLAKAQGED